jgi:hypothetical protein
LLRQLAVHFRSARRNGEEHDESEHSGQQTQITPKPEKTQNINPKHLVWNFLTFENLDLFRISDFVLRILWSQNFKSLWLESLPAK